MTSKQLEIIVNAKDNATAALNSIGDGLRNLGNKAASANQSFIGLLKAAAGLTAVKLASDAIRDGANAWLEYEKGTKKDHEDIFRFIKQIPLIGGIAETGESLGKAMAEHDLRKIGMGEVDIARRAKAMED